MNIAIFEDNDCLNLYPLTQTKPVWDIFCGTRTIAERIKSGLKDSGEIYFYTRKNLSGLYKTKYPHIHINELHPLKKGQTTLFINAAASDISMYGKLEPGETIHDADGTPIAACISLVKDIDPSAIAKEIILNTKKSIQSTAGHPLYKYLWDIIDANPEIIISDVESIPRVTNDRGFIVMGDPDAVIAAAGVSVEPGVVFNTRGGPVIIDEGCEIHAFSRIEGPAFIGAGSIILGAKIRSGTSIGPGCRIGGEIEQSIFHSNSNKYHDGFIGHSYIGEWVNMGAMTTNSDLKNNYSPVSVYINGFGKINTGRMKIGCFIGDFVKTSIGTLFATGSVAATGAMIVHAGMLTPANIPPFGWFINNSLSSKEWKDEFIESAGVMIGRRKKNFSHEYISLIENLYDATAHLREKK